MKKVISLSVAFMATATCFAQSGKLTINGAVIDSTLNGKYVYIIDAAQNKLLDSCKIDNLKFNYGTDVAQFVMLRVGANRNFANIIVEDGTVNVKLGRPSEVSGSTLNDAFADFNTKTSKLKKEFSVQYKDMKAKNASETELDTEYNKYQTKVNASINDLFEANQGNNLGLMMLSEKANEMSLDELKKATLEFGAKAANFDPIQRVIKRRDNEEKTKAGTMFVDFAAVNPDGSAAKLSDYVGKGNYVLADFWASWCGPCRAEVPHIKELYEQYKDKGLVVLGVNVWDNKEAFEKAVKSLAMPWAQICSFEGNAPTDTYGINGIPHIILFAPDGTIVERNLRGDGMKAKIAEIYKNK